MSKYFIEKQWLPLDRSTDFAFSTDLVTFRAIYRADETFWTQMLLKEWLWAKS